MTNEQFEALVARLAARAKADLAGYWARVMLFALLGNGCPLWTGGALATSYRTEAVIVVRTGAAPAAKVIERMRISVKPLGYERGQAMDGKPSVEETEGEARFAFVDVPRLETDISATLDKRGRKLSVRYSERGQAGCFSKAGQERFRQFLVAMRQSFGKEAVVVEAMPQGAFQQCDDGRAGK